MYKMWRALLHRVTANQQSKREQTHPVFSRKGKVQIGGKHSYTE